MATFVYLLKNVPNHMIDILGFVTYRISRGAHATFEQETTSIGTIGCQTIQQQVPLLKGLIPHLQSL